MVKKGSGGFEVHFSWAVKKFTGRCNSTGRNARLMKNALVRKSLMLSQKTQDVIPTNREGSSACL